MAKTVIRSAQLTPPPAPLSPAILSQGFVFISGQPPYFGDRQVAKGDFEAQFRQVMHNILTLLNEAGSSIEKVVKTQVFLTDAANFAHMNALYREYFPADAYPARTTMICGLGNPDFLLEIECIAEA